MAKLNTADIGFEDQIWKAADKMRGNIDASEYKSVVLGLTSELDIEKKEVVALFREPTFARCVYM